MANLKITLVKSTIGAVPKNKKTVEALGLRKLNKTVEMPDNESVRGMIRQVRHMVKVEEIVLPPKENTEDAEGETVKKTIYIFPPEWAGTFGKSITSIAQVGILQQENYSGNWDVLRPAAEIKEMDINPLLATEKAVIAVDARIRIEK